MVSQAGFLSFIRNVMGIPAAVLPDNSLFITYAYTVAIEIVNLQLCAVSPTIYSLAVYNLAGDNLINYAPDPVAQGFTLGQSTLGGGDVLGGGETTSNFFSNLRKSFEIGDFVAGVVSSTSDNGTSTSVLTPDQFKELTLGNLQNMKTPYGRQYLAFAQSVGSNWGIS